MLESLKSGEDSIREHLNKVWQCGNEPCGHLEKSPSRGNCKAKALGRGAW